MKEKRAKELSRLTKADLISIVLEHSQDYTQVNTPARAYEMLTKAVKPAQIAEKEYFFVITMDGAMQCLNVHTVTAGLVNRTLVHPREVFKPAIMENATSVIVAHNHPSGSLKASPEDKDVTRRLKEAGEILGIKVQDHIIFSNAGYQSMLENNTF